MVVGAPSFSSHLILYAQRFAPVVRPLAARRSVRAERHGSA
jgi:hypothetical protein